MRQGGRQVNKQLLYSLKGIVMGQRVKGGKDSFALHGVFEEGLME